MPVTKACRTKDLLVPRMLQPNCLFCGPTCAAMVLRALGSAAYGGEDELVELKSEMDQFPVAGLETSPQGLELALHQRLRSARYRYEETFWTDAEVGTRQILATVLAGAPAVVLWEDGSHWVVVSGFEAEDCIDGDRPVPVFKILVDDPYNSCLTDCGSAPRVGRVALRTCEPRLNAERRSVIGWLKDFGPSIHLQNHRAGVIARGIAPEVDIQLVKQRGLRREGSLRVERYVELGIDFLRLDEDREFRAAMTEGSIQRSVLVERLDSGGSPYFLVELGAAQGALAVLSIDADSGAVLGAQAYEEPTKAAVPDPEAAAERIRSAKPIFSLEGTDLRLDEVFDPEAPMVWMPSQESRSSFDPFFRIVTGLDSHPELFLDVNGVLHTQLRTDVP